MDSFRIAAETLAYVATVLGFGTVIVASIAALRQVGEMARARQLEGLIRLFELVGSQRARANRKYVYTRLPADPSSAGDDDWEVVEEVCVELDRVGTLVMTGVVPADIVLESHGEVFPRAWAKLEPYVRTRRSQLTSRHYKNFENLAVMAAEWFRVYYPNETLNIEP